MNKLIIYCSFVALFVFGIFAVDSHVSAQDITGAYGDASVTDKDVVKATKFAVKSRSTQIGKRFTLVRIQKAESQLVAGMNYRVCLRVRDSRKRISTITAVVYKDLKNRYSLSRWKAGGCSEL